MTARTPPPPDGIEPATFGFLCSTHRIKAPHSRTNIEEFILPGGLNKDLENQQSPSTLVVVMDSYRRLGGHECAKRSVSVSFCIFLYLPDKGRIFVINAMLCYRTLLNKTTRFILMQSIKGSAHFFKFK